MGENKPSEWVSDLVTKFGKAYTIGNKALSASITEFLTEFLSGIETSFYRFDTELSALQSNIRQITEEHLPKAIADALQKYTIEINNRFGSFINIYEERLKGIEAKLGSIEGELQIIKKDLPGAKAAFRQLKTDIDQHKTADEGKSQDLTARISTLEKEIRSMVGYREEIKTAAQTAVQEAVSRVQGAPAIDTATMKVAIVTSVDDYLKSPEGQKLIRAAITALLSKAPQTPSNKTEPAHLADLLKDEGS